MAYSTSAKPLPFYADGETPLEELVDKFGSRLERLTPFNKFMLLATISLAAAFDDEEASLDAIYDEINEAFLPNPLDPELLWLLPKLNTLSADNLLGLCEALVAQVRYTREVR
jgi:hypothetical protein